MTTEKISPYDPAEDLISPETVAEFLADALETNDPAYIANALGVVARAKGMGEIARETGLSREQLYRSFSANGNPTLKSTLAVMKALGVEMTVSVARG
jgi:probable addiction module antidote protein